MPRMGVASTSVMDLSDHLQLDEAAATPLYLQLSHKLAAAIAAGLFAAHEALPSERSLCAELGISRVTARKALDMLIEQGLVRRTQGSGTFIARRVQPPLSRLTSFSEDLHSRGFVPASRWLVREITRPSPEEVVKLSLSVADSVARLKRVRLADETAMAIELSTLPATLVPEPRAVSESLYAFLERRGTPVASALQQIRAINATAEQAELLGIRRGAALLLIIRLGYLANKSPVELTHTWCRADYFDFVAELRRG